MRHLQNSFLEKLFYSHIALKIQSLNIFSLNSSQTILHGTTVLVIIVGVHEIVEKQLTMGGLIAIFCLQSTCSSSTTISSHCKV